jgi:hypothetical protein
MQSQYHLDVLLVYSEVRYSLLANTSENRMDDF